MPIKKFATKEEVPEAQRESALELADGSFLIEEPELGDSGKRALDAMKTERDDAKRAQQLAESKLAQAEAEALARKNGATEEDLKRIREAAEAERAPILEENERLKGELQKLRLTDRVRALFLEHGGMGERSEDAMVFLEKRTQLGDAGGIVFKDKDGKTTADDAGAFFPKFKAEKPYLFNGTGASGGGSGGSTGGKVEDVPPASGRVEEERRRQVAGAF